MCKHNGIKTSGMDHLGREILYCPDCAALTLVSETEYIQLLDDKGCNKLNRDFNDVHTVTHVEPMVSE